MTFADCVLSAVFAGKNTNMITQSYLSYPSPNFNFFKNVIDCTWIHILKKSKSNTTSTNIGLWIKILTCYDLDFSLSRRATDVDLHLTDTSRWVTSRSIWCWTKAAYKFCFAKSRIRINLSISKRKWIFLECRKCNEIILFHWSVNGNNKIWLIWMVKNKNESIVILRMLFTALE